MNLGLQLRKDRDYIRRAGIETYETDNFTYYVASGYSPKLVRQIEALKQLSHLELGPRPGQLFALRGLTVLPTRHQPLASFRQHFDQGDRQDKVGLVRRFGAALGMVHSLKFMDVGPINQPRSGTRSSMLKSMVLGAGLGSGQKSLMTSLLESIDHYWRAAGSNLVVGWQGWPQLRVSTDALLFMDFSQALFFEPLWDLVRLEPSALDMGPEFWEFFLQGYCASGELERNWRDKIQVLYQVAELIAQAKGYTDRGLYLHFHSRWWEKL